jgi:tRNA dimethylallyltransferase
LKGNLRLKDIPQRSFPKPGAAKKKVVFLVGPTATGKTETAVLLARKIGGEIISCDSMQVYKRMDIITSKPSAALLKKVPHHLIGVASVRQEYNVSRYRRQALATMKEVISRGKIPLFVGGTGLYMSILVDGIFKEKPSHPRTRALLYRQAQQRGSGYLHGQLQKIDPEAALKIHPHDTRRIVRALEVFKSTGRPISELQKQRRGLADTHEVKMFCLTMRRSILNRRIDRRLESMFAHGLLDEARALCKLDVGRTAAYAIGLKELKDYFEGTCSLDEAKALMKRATRQYARRQLTWFRKDKRIQWIAVNSTEAPREVAARIWKKLS